MIDDPIVAEVRTAREKLFESCNGDLAVLLDKLKEQEQQERGRVVSKRALHKNRHTKVG